MAGFSIRSPGFGCFGISVLLLIILLQILMLYFGGVFIQPDEVLIGPSFFCPNRQHDKLPCSRWERPKHSSHIDLMFDTMIPVCFYVPVVLVAFGLLSMMFAAYGKDRTTLKCSLFCQAASSLLTLGGIILFLIRYHSFQSWKDMTLWFYLCVGVELQLIVTTVLTRVLGRTLTSDWK